MVTIGLVGKRIAKENFVFQFLGSVSECKDCPLKNICFSLDQGKYYRIVKIREKEHDCKIHDLGKVLTVELEELPVPVAVEKSKAIEGSVLTFSGDECNQIFCNYYDLCNPVGLRTGSKFKIESVLDDIECPKGKDLKRVLVRW